MAYFKHGDAKYMGTRQESNYSEDTVSIALQMLLSTVCFPLPGFFIMPFTRHQERKFGVDARLLNKISGIMPFYMQFKRPSAYPAESTSPIINGRNEQSCEVNPRALFFELRKKKENHRQSQHNILYKLRTRLRAREIGDATYVCPLFLDRITYVWNMQMGALLDWFPFGYREPWRRRAILIKDASNILQFSDIPTFREHISIPPHTRVNTTSHAYSFTERGNEVCFHSKPIALSPDSTYLLGNWFEKLLKQFKNGGIIKKNDADKELSKLSKETGYEFDFPKNENYGQSVFEKWLDFGEHLKTEYDIDQFMFIKLDDY